MTDPTLGDWAAAAGALFTAVAAWAAFRAARHSREAVEAAERPRLEAQVLSDPETGLLRLSIVNTGRGVARGANFTVHAMGHAVEAVLGDGFVEPGARIHVLTTIGPLSTPPTGMRGDVPDLAVMLAYRDAAGFVHYRALAGQERVPRTLLLRRPKYPPRHGVFKKLYPAIALDAAARAQHQLVSV